MAHVTRRLRDAASRLGFGFEWLIVRYGGQMQGPYRREDDALRDFGGLRGVTLFRRRTWHGRWRSPVYEPWPGKDEPAWWETGETSWL